MLHDCFKTDIFTCPRDEMKEAAPRSGCFVGRPPSQAVGRTLSGGLLFWIVFSVFCIELFQNAFPFDHAQEFLVFDDRDGFQVFGDR